MKKLLYYSGTDVFTKKDVYENIPGGENFSYLFKLMGNQTVIYDRTNTIQIPLHFHLPEHLKLPEYKIFNKSFDEICCDAALELYARAQKNNRKIAIMYSGGIDSTTVVVAFMKVLPKDKLKDITILMNDQSIHENQNLYEKYISKNFKCVPSYNYIYYAMSDDYFLLSGEQADMLFLGMLYTSLVDIQKYPNMLHDDYRQHEDLIIQGLEKSLPPHKKKDTAKQVYDFFDYMANSCPIKIVNVMDLTWWLNFALKWQSCYYRTIGFVPDPSKIKFEESYSTFYNSPEFQLWTINNRDKIFKENFDSYKYIQKEFIYDFDKNYYYLTQKKKIGSLANTIRRKKPFVYMDTEMNFSHTKLPEEFYNNDNYFTNFSS
jgi:hypothetical protein